MKKLLFILLMFTMVCTLNCYSADYNDLRSFLEKKIDISQLEIKTLKLKAKTLKDVTYDAQLDAEKQHLKILKRELEIVNDAIDEIVKCAKLQKEYEESAAKLNSLTHQVENIIEYEKILK